jgi:hypothetical protein
MISLIYKQIGGSTTAMLVTATVPVCPDEKTTA